MSNVKIIFFPHTMLNFPLLFLFTYDVSEGGVRGDPQLLILADRKGVQKGLKYADVILEQLLKSVLVG